MREMRLPRGRILDEAHAVPHQAADIQLVAQDAGAARGMATDGGVTPGASLGAGEGFGIQCLGDGDGRMALGEHPEDAGDGLGLALVDGPVAAHRFAMRVGLPQRFIAIAQPAGRFTAHDPAPEAAMRLVGEVLQEQRVHRALEADMQLGNLAFRQGHQLDAGEFEPLVQPGDIFLVARQPVQRLRQHDVEAAFACSRQHCLVTGAKAGGPGNSGVAVDLLQVPALGRDTLPAEPDLVLDRRLALAVTGIAGIDGNTGGHGGTG